MIRMDRCAIAVLGAAVLLLTGCTAAGGAAGATGIATAATTSTASDMPR